MKRSIKIILLVIVVGAVGYTGFVFLAAKGVVPINVVPNARTLYEGQVNIEPVVLSEIEKLLTAKNVHHINTVERIEIYPHGPGFGPLSFTLTETLIKAQKDIPGTPDPEKYKEEVRQDVRDIGGILSIKENSWKITKTTYPFTAIY